MAVEKPVRILFLCTGNSCRSQMAEGWLRELAGERCVSLSAGSKPSGYVHPLAVKAMNEVGVDITAGVSKSINEFLPPAGEPPEIVVSVCDSAAEECPTFPGPVQRIHRPFDDPAHATGTAAEQMAVIQRVRDEIRQYIADELLPSL